MRVLAVMLFLFVLSSVFTLSINAENVDEYENGYKVVKITSDYSIIEVNDAVLFSQSSLEFENERLIDLQMRTQLDAYYYPLFALQNLNYYYYAEFISSVTTKKFAVVVKIPVSDFYVPPYLRSVNEKIEKYLTIIIADKNEIHNNVFAKLVYSLKVKQNYVEIVCLDETQNFMLIKNKVYSFYIFYTLDNHISYRREIIFEKYFHFVTKKDSYHTNLKVNYSNLHVQNYSIKGECELYEYVKNVKVECDVKIFDTTLVFTDLKILLCGYGVEIFANEGYSAAIIDKTMQTVYSLEIIVNTVKIYCFNEDVVIIVNDLYSFSFKKLDNKLLIKLKSYTHNVALNLTCVEYAQYDYLALKIYKVEYPTSFDFLDIYEYNNTRENYYAFYLIKLTHNEYKMLLKHVTYIKKSEIEVITHEAFLPFTLINFRLTAEDENYVISYEEDNYTFSTTVTLTKLFKQYVLQPELINIQVPLIHFLYNNVVVFTYYVSGKPFGLIAGSCFLHRLRHNNYALYFDELAPAMPARYITDLQLYPRNLTLFSADSQFEKHIFVFYRTKHYEFKDDVLMLLLSPTIREIRGNITLLNLYMIVYTDRTEIISQSHSFYVVSYENDTRVIKFFDVIITAKLRKDITTHIIVLATSINYKSVQHIASKYKHYFTSQLSSFTYIPKTFSINTKEIATIVYGVLLISLLFLFALFNALNVISASALLISLTAIFSVFNLIEITILYIVLAIVALFAVIFVTIRFAGGGGE